MSATGKTPILLYGSSTPTNVPVAGNLTNSSDGCEIAINVADKNLFFKDSTNAVNTVPIRQSNASSNGWLSSTDWSTFNNKVSSPWLVSGSDIYYNTGNIGVGAIPSAWNSALKVVQSNGGSISNNGNTTIVGSNVYYDSGYTPKYIVTGHAGSILYNPTGSGGWAFNVAASGSAGATVSFATGLTIDTSANVTVSTGNLVIGTSGKGIDFSATAGTGTSELLADYEEGTWTPTVYGGTTAGSTGYVAQAGHYTKVGRVVNFRMYVQWNSQTGSGNLTIGGLPYTSATTYYPTACSVITSNLTFTANSSLSGAVADGGTTITISQSVNNAATTTVQVDTDGVLTISGMYFT